MSVWLKPSAQRMVRVKRLSRRKSSLSSVEITYCAISNFNVKREPTTLELKSIDQKIKNAKYFAETKGCLFKILLEIRITICIKYMILDLNSNRRK